MRELEPPGQLMDIYRPYITGMNAGLASADHAASAAAGIRRSRNLRRNSMDEGVREVIENYVRRN
jgi:hypothetical protein